MNQEAIIQNNEDNQNDIDGCDALIEVADETSDEDLPVAEGGVG